MADMQRTIEELRDTLRLLEGIQARRPNPSNELEMELARQEVGVVSQLRQILTALDQRTPARTGKLRRGPFAGAAARKPKP